MTEREAAAELWEADVVTYARVSMPYGKEVVSTCLGAGVPAILGGDPGCHAGGCSPKVAILVRRGDVSRVAQLLRHKWISLAKSEGDLDPDLRIRPAPAPAAAAEADEPPCPACGTAAPLVEGACSDCGLVLA